MDLEDYSVYSVLVNSEQGGGRRSLVMILDHTGLRASPRLVEPERVPDEVLEDFRLKNEATYLLERNFQLLNNYHLLSATEYAGISRSAPVITLSRVGFDNSRELALVCIAHTKGAIADSDYFVILRKIKGRWMVQRRLAVLVDE